MSEKREQAAIVQLLKSIGGQVYVLGTVRRKGDYAGTMQTPGLPDLLAFLPSAPNVSDWQWTLLCIEVKARGGRLRAAQKLFAEQCFGAGIEHLVGGIDVVIQWATEAGYVVG